jgi:hypothetical protein
VRRCRLSWCAPFGYLSSGMLNQPLSCMFTSLCACFSLPLSRHAHLCSSRRSYALSSAYLFVPPSSLPVWLDAADCLGDRADRSAGSGFVRADARAELLPRSGYSLLSALPELGEMRKDVLTAPRLVLRRSIGSRDSTAAGVTTCCSQLLCV